MNHPTEIDDGPPRERCTFCGGDPMGFTACCPAEDTDETVWVDSEGKE